MRNIFKSLFIAAVTLLNIPLLAAKDPSSTLDIKEAAAGSAYYTLDAVPEIKNLDWVGYNSTGSGSGGCVTTSHWKLSNSRTLTFKVKNCTKIEAKDAYFSKDATTVLKYSVNGATAVAFATNGDQKKTCASGSFETGNTGEITVVLSADNDVTLNNILFYTGEGGDTPGGGDDPTPGGGDDPTPGGGDDPQPTGDVYAHWRFSGTDVPAIGSSESGTKINVEFLAKDDSKTYGVESAGYNANVPEDMKSQGTKGIKLGGNVLYLKVTITGGFKAKDVVTICGYNPWKVSSTDAHEGDVAASVATGTSKTDYNIGSFTLSADADALYMMRAEGSGTCICAIKVTRGGGDTPPEPEKSHDATLKSLTYGSESTSVPDFAPTKLSYSVVLPSDYVGGAPSIQAEQNDEKATLDISQATSLPGTATAVVTAEDGTTKKTYSVTFSKEGTEPPATVDVTGVTLDQTSLTLKIGNTATLTATVAPSNATNKNISWSSNKESVATVANGVVTAKAEGTATITVTTEDGGFTATCEVTVKKEETPDVPVPSTSLTLHEPGIYEESAQKGGYDAQLTIFNFREYEVFYVNRDASGSNIAIATTNVDKSGNICDVDKSTSNNTVAKDGWFKVSSNGTGGDNNATASAEFDTSIRSCKLTSTSHSLEMHIKGYDEFSFYGKDNNKDASKNKMFEVYIDDVKQTRSPLSDYGIERFSITPGEHVIRVTGSAGNGDNKLCSFSLRVAQVPSVKYLKGNDSTQVVLQTENLPRAITYYTKYNKLGETRVIWEDKEATGIELKVKSSTEIGDTLVLSGQAMCEVGVYPFHVSSFFNGVETKRLPSGKFTVTSDIRAIGEPKVEVYQGEAMEELEFSYHALSADDITLTWTNGTPDGVTGHGENGKYYISGIPTQIGEFTFTISVKGGNSIDGLVSVKELVIGDNPVLYLYTNADAYTKDGIITFLTTKGYDFVPRKAKRDGLRPTEDYKKYNWVLISEDANADNAEVLALTQESSILPVLNMKSFSYAKERLGWGDPNNGGLKEPDARYITVQRDDHPIFKALNKSKGSKIEVLSKIDEKGLMPIDINRQGTFCLATALTRAKEDYYENGDPQTFLHEVPAAMRGGKKYICLPIAMSSSNNLTTAGKQLVEAIVNYLLNNEPSIQRPELEITSFTINGIAGKFEGNKIIFEIDLAEHTDIDKYAIAPQVTIASDYTHVTPASGATIDFSESWSYPVAYEVSDYINRRVYEVAIRFYSSEGIEDVYAVGDWVNIYDIFGRKVSTTNEDIYHMVLPRGIYVIVTETGETFKIMR